MTTRLTAIEEMTHLHRTGQVTTEVRIRTAEAAHTTADQAAVLPLARRKKWR
jgi:hypothetical protein